MLRVGYSAWGFLGDNKIENGIEVSTPDGNASYSWSILWELQQRGYQVFWMQKNRDAEAVSQFWRKNFSSFSNEKRWLAYQATYQTGGRDLPDLDILLLEWRFPIPGRNTDDDVMSSAYQPDLRRQSQLLEHYSARGTKIVVWDLDHKLTVADEEMLLKLDRKVAVFETSVSPLNQWITRTRVEPPVVPSALTEHPTLPSDAMQKSVYIGSRYERDDVITEWLGPLMNFFPMSVQFWGNWMNTVDECRKLWPHVKYNARVTMKDFRRVYGNASTCPLLAKRSYLESGFITPRPWEAVIFGTIPVGLGTHKGIEQYTPIVAHTPTEMISHAAWLSRCSLQERNTIREETAHLLSRCDVKHFVDRLEDVANS